MGHMRSTVLLLALCCSVGASANRQLLQMNGQMPTFTGLPLTVTNGADPSATQTTVPDPTTGTPVPAPTTLNPVLPAAIPDGKSYALQVQTPAGTAQVPAAQSPILPTLAANTPAPQQAIPVRAPSPAPVIPTLKAPTPAPAQPILKAPTPAPQVQARAPTPVPAPAPSQTPQCGVKPECRIFLEDMLCCDSAGIINNKQHLVMRMMCTHPVNYYPKCLNVTGPTNFTAFNQFDSAVWSSSHTVQLNINEEYLGNATLDIEGPRTNANLSAGCGLYITPCQYNGSIVTKVAPVLGMSFTTLDTDSFLEVASSVDDDINNLDSLVMPNLYYPSACQQQDLGSLGAEFYANDWATYNMGFQNMCNYTAFAEALAPAPQPIAGGSVSTSSLG